MGKILLDHYLTSNGVTAQNCQTALRLSDNNLAEHTLTFKVITETKKKGQFWRLQLFLDDYPDGLTIGLESYKESEFQTTLRYLKKAPGISKRRGIWPKKKQILLWMGRQQKASAQAKERAERKTAKEAAKPKKQEDRQKNLLPRALASLTQTQKNLQEIQHKLQTAYHVLHQEILAVQKTEEGVALEKMLLAAMAYANDANLKDQIVAATQEKKQIFLWDSEQNLILKMPQGNTIEYQGIVFSFKEINIACSRVQVLRTQMAQKKAEKWQATLLANIPKHLEAQIQAVQQHAEQQWDRTLFLKETDLKFMAGYKRSVFKFHKVASNIQTQEQMNDWITAWLMRVETALATPSPADASTQTILGLVACSPKYGRQTYAMWLGNSKAKTLQDKKLDNLFRGAFKNDTIAAIVAKIDTIINYQWLTVTKVGTHHLPVLVISNKGKKVLRILEQKHRKASGAPPTMAVPAPIAADIHSHLYWLQEMQQKGHPAYVDFLNTPQSIANIAHWAEDEVAAMQRLLNERMQGWQALAQWQLSKHPIKYKPLQRLLAKVCD